MIKNVQNEKKIRWKNEEISRKIRPKSELRTIEVVVQLGYGRGERKRCSSQVVRDVHISLGFFNEISRQLVVPNFYVSGNFA